MAPGRYPNQYVKITTAGGEWCVSSSQFVKISLIAQWSAQCHHLSPVKDLEPWVPQSSRSSLAYSWLELVERNRTRGFAVSQTNADVRGEILPFSVPKWPLKPEASFVPAEGRPWQEIFLTIPPLLLPIHYCCVSFTPSSLHVYLVIYYWKRSMGNHSSRLGYPFEQTWKSVGKEEGLSWL